MSKYVSPMIRARAIVAGEIQPVTTSQRHHALRMVRLSATVVTDLETEEALTHVFRWVAWASSSTEQRRRTDLVIHLRHSIERKRNGWLDVPHWTAAMDAWDQARSEVRKRGGIMPAVFEVPLGVYRAAVEGARKQPQAAPESEPTETAADEDVDPGTGEAVDGDDEEESDDESVDEDESDNEPSSIRQLRGRDRVLRVLSDTARSAIASKDLEAADTANQAISLLCRKREVG